MLSVEETSVGKKRARAGLSSWTRVSPLGALRSRMEMLAPAEMRLWMVARPRPEALATREVSCGVRGGGGRVRTHRRL